MKMGLLKKETILTIGGEKEREKRENKRRRGAVERNMKNWERGRMW